MTSGKAWSGDPDPVTVSGAPDRLRDGMKVRHYESTPEDAQQDNKENE